MKLLENYFQLLAFNTIQFLDLLKDNKINDKKRKTNTPKAWRQFHRDLFL
jgi:sulfatase maturation enzyme AslB (radical SAM superfamily)